MENAASSADSNLHVIPIDTPICQLDCKAAFENLTAKERLYAHYFARASFEGSLIVALQTSPESGGILVLLHRLFSAEPFDELKKKATACDIEWAPFAMWAAFVFYNCGNYKSFGDRKFVPGTGVAAANLEKLVGMSKAAVVYPDLLSIYAAVEHAIFSVDNRTSELGFNPDGVTSYHSENVTKADSDLINRYMNEKNLELWNTRLFKEEVNGRTTLTIRSASIDSSSAVSDEFEGLRIRLEKGDFAGVLERVCPILDGAAKHAANETQRAVMRKFVEHFTTGDLKDHREASRLWIKDVNPSVETFMGFMREYRDPAGTRAEFMGIVAAVNKETSKKFGRLVERAEEFLPRLPWGAAYEKDRFLRPDFTALDIIACGTSGIVQGWIIPHMYNDIKQNEGFKNLALSNSIAAVPKQKVNFVTEEDEKLLHEYTAKSFEVQVGCHELLGHGSGKLFQSNADGTFNFDKENTVDILTGGKITSWYEPGETWESLFGHLAGGIEECRCEAVGFVLSCDQEILDIFYSDGSGQQMKYVNWLSTLLRGLNGLEMYSPDKKKWGQPHSWARFIVLKVLLEAGDGCLTIEETTDPSGSPDLSFRLDPAKIDSVGAPAVREFVKKLQAYKSTADVKGATALFEKYGVNERDLKWRDIVISKMAPRRFFVQSNTKLTDHGKDVELVTYPETAEGVIQSTVERFSSESIDVLAKLWAADKKYFPRAYGQ